MPFHEYKVCTSSADPELSHAAWADSKVSEAQNFMVSFAEECVFYLVARARSAVNFSDDFLGEKNLWAFSLWKISEKCLIFLGRSPRCVLDHFCAGGHLNPGFAIAQWLRSGILGGAFPRWHQHPGPSSWEREREREREREGGRARKREQARPGYGKTGEISAIWDCSKIESATDAKVKNLSEQQDFLLTGWFQPTYVHRWNSIPISFPFELS